MSKENYKSSLIKNLQALTNLMRKYPVSSLIDKVFSKGSIEAIDRYVIPALEKGQACVESIEFFDNAKDFLALPTNLKVMFSLEQVAIFFSDLILSSSSFFTKDIQVPTKSGFCDDTTVAGTDLPDRRIINVGGSNKQLRFSYETFQVKDQIDIYYQNSLIYSTGCVGARGTVTLPINGNETNVIVKVSPNCEGTTGTQWNYVLQCQESFLICKDNACSCYPSGTPNQIREPEYDGCGSSQTQSATVYGWIFDIGDVWGFTNICNQHDICYGTCGSNRLNCDSNFCQSLRSSCQSQPKMNYNRCLKYADIYCKAVTLMGEVPFNEGQISHCKCPNNYF